ncbi:MAG: Xaa-Pro peptidase family protein [Candidatus Limnocylindria bacterium]
MTVPRELAFEVSEYRTRLASVRRQMGRRGLDALVLFGPQNVCYVSGLDNDNLSDLQCVVVPIDRDPVLILFWFEAGRAQNTCWLDEVVLYRDEEPTGIVAGVIRQLGLAGGRLGVERPTVGLTVTQYERLVGHLSDASIEDSFGAVEIPRRVKSAAEIGYMRRAAGLTDRALEAACALVDVGVSDGELAAAITSVIYGEGGETTCLGPIVAGGYRAGAPHSSFNGRRLEAGDSVFLEFTAQVRRYTAPIMRSVWLGRPSAEVERIAEAGAAAVATIVRTARPGIPASDVARAARADLEPILDRVMFHNTYGYPVGLGFPPTWSESLGFYLRADNHQPLQAGMTFHLPISLRRFGEWGVSQSHTLLITETGAETLTRSTARLLVLDRAGAA